MCGTLSEVTGVTLKSIMAELVRLTSEKERNIASERNVIIDKLNRDLRFSGTDAISIISQTLTTLHDLAIKHDNDKLSEEACLRLLDEQKDLEDSRGTEFQGFRLGNDLSDLEEALSGEWKKDVLCLFGGKANSGKTSLLAKMAVEIAKITENNACVIFHTIDDTAQQFLPKWICIGERLGMNEAKPTLRINEVRFPNYYASTDHGTNTKAKRTIGYSEIRKLMQLGRLILKDSNDGNSIASAETMIRYYKERYPDRNIVYILDNLHKLRDNQSNSDERVRFRTISERVKNLATRHHITVLATVEYTKLAPGTRPTNYNIAETVQLEYDANLAVHLYNEVHDMGEEHAANQGSTHVDEQNGQQKPLPVIELSIGKNKISDFKNKLYLKFFPASSDFMQSDAPVPVQVEDESSSSNGNGMFSPKRW
jgi:replicative DNA helicase